MISSKTVKESLDKALKENDTVFLVPHNRPDMDAIGACIGMNVICNKKDKNTYIVIDDDIDTLENATKTVIKDIHQEFNIIKAKEVKDLITDHSLLIILDTNKRHMISVKDYLYLFRDILIIDHHRTDNNTIKARYLFTDDSLSSTCEKVGLLLSSYGFNIEPKYATYLLAGIILDTNDWERNVSGNKAHIVASSLIDDGADSAVAKSMIKKENYEHYKAVREIIDHTDFHTVTYAIANDVNNNLYDIEDIAKAADNVLNFDVNASFALAYIDPETVYISARSKGLIDVEKVMSAFGGGGTKESAAARVKGYTIDQIKRRINEILIPTSYLDMGEIIDQPLTLKKTLK